MSLFDDLNYMVDTANKVVGTANKVVGTANEVRGTINCIKDTFTDNKEYDHSEECKRDWAEINRLQMRNMRVFFFYILLNLFIIGCTIYLCIVGNPIVLQWLHIVN